MTEGKNALTFEATEQKSEKHEVNFDIIKNIEKSKDDNKFNNDNYNKELDFENNTRYNSENIKNEYENLLDFYSTLDSQNNIGFIDKGVYKFLAQTQGVKNFSKDKKKLLVNDFKITDIIDLLNINSNNYLTGEKNFLINCANSLITNIKDDLEKLLIFDKNKEKIRSLIEKVTLLLEKKEFKERVAEISKNSESLSKKLELIFDDIKHDMDNFYSELLKDEVNSGEDKTKNKKNKINYEEYRSDFDQIYKKSKQKILTTVNFCNEIAKKNIEKKIIDEKNNKKVCNFLKQSIKINKIKANQLCKAKSAVKSVKLRIYKNLKNKKNLYQIERYCKLKADLKRYRKQSRKIKRDLKLTKLGELSIMKQDLKKYKMVINNIARQEKQGYIGKN